MKALENQIEIIPIDKLVENPKNPRKLTKKKFKKLQKSIEEFPEMLELRPIVIDADNVVLGGNMRLRACKKIGMLEIPIIRAENFDAEKIKQFIIKDNLPFGEWDMDMLANEWEIEKLEEWGLDLKLNPEDVQEKQNPKNQDSEFPFAIELDQKSNYIVLKIDTDIDFLQVQTLLGLETVHSKRANGKPWSRGIGRVINWSDALERIKNS